FVPKQRRWNDHARVIAALVNLEVGAASQCRLHLDEDFAFLHTGNRHLLDLDVLFAVEDGGCHLASHFGVYLVPDSGRTYPASGWITIFNEPGCGWAAISSASTARMS